MSAVLVKFRGKHASDWWHRRGESFEEDGAELIRETDRVIWLVLTDDAVADLIEDAMQHTRGQGESSVRNARRNARYLLKQTVMAGIR